jgi:hypothetical protein
MSDTWAVGQEVYRYRDHTDASPKRHKIWKVRKATIILETGEKFWRDGVRVGDKKLIYRCHIEAIRETPNSESPT